MLTKDQGTSIAYRIAYGAIMFLSMKAMAKGYITEDMATYVAVGGATAVDGALSWWNNRPVAVQQAAANSGAIVITTKAIADATPNSPNIVSTIQEAKEVVQ